MSVYVWSFGSGGEGLQFKVEYDTTTQKFTVTGLVGSFDLNALWFSDGDSTAGEGGIALVKKDSSLNMNGTGVLWDDYYKISDTGLGSAGTTKTSYITAGETLTLDATQMGLFNGLDLTTATLGVRATSTSTGDGIKWVDTAPELVVTNTAPDATNDQFYVDEDAATDAAGNVLGNDTDPEDGAPTVKNFTVGGTTYLAGAVATLANGATLSVAANGSVTLDQNGAYNSLAGGETADVSFSYTAVDSAGLTDTADVTVTVNGVEDAPDATNDQFYVDEDAATDAAGNVLGNDTDPEDGAPTVKNFTVGGTTYLAGAVATLANGATLSVAANGSVTLDQNGAYNSLAGGETADVSFSYTAVDSAGLTDTADVTVTVNGVEDAPDATNDQFYVDEDAATDAAGNVLGNDTDPEDGAPTVKNFTVGGTTYLAGAVATLANGATLSVAANGSVTLDQNGAYNSLAGGETADVSFSYTAVDSAGLTDTADVTVTVNGVEDAPDATNDQFYVDEDAATDAAGNVLGNDTDPEDGAPTVKNFTVGGTTYVAGAVATLANGATLSVAANGSVTLDQNGAYNSLAGGETADVSFSYTAVDSAGLTDTADVTVTVNGVEDAPDATNDQFYVDEDAATDAAGNVLGNDTDPEDGAPTVKNFTVGGTTYLAGAVATLANGATLSVAANGSVTLDQNGAYNSLAGGETADVSFSYTAVDSAGLTDTADVTVTVNGVEDAPDATNDQFYVDEDAATDAAGNVLGNDTDPEDGAPTVKNFTVGGTTYVAGAVATLANGATLSVAANGSVTLDQNGAYNSLAGGETADVSFSYTAVDSAGLTDTADVTVTVNGVNDPPDAKNDIILVSRGDTWSISTSTLLSNDTDVDSDTLTVTSIVANGATDWQVVLNGDGTLSVTAGTGDAAFTYTISDGDGGTDTATVTFKGVTTSDSNSSINVGTIYGAYDYSFINWKGGNDTATNGTGNDTWIGGSGNDTLSPAGGTNVLTGNLGNDTFQFSKINGAVNIITDFTRTGAGNNDSLSFSDGLAAGDFSIGNNDGSKSYVEGNSLAATNVAGSEIVVWTTALSDSDAVQALIDQHSNITTGALFAVINQDGDDRAQIWYDANPSDAGGAVLVGELTNITTVTQLQSADSGWFTFT